MDQCMLSFFFFDAILCLCKSFCVCVCMCRFEFCDILDLFGVFNLMYVLVLRCAYKKDVDNFGKWCSEKLRSCGIYTQKTTTTNTSYTCYEHRSINKWVLRLFDTHWLHWRDIQIVFDTNPKSNHLNAHRVREYDYLSLSLSVNLLWKWF